MRAPKTPCFDGDAERPELLAEALVEWLSDLRSRRVGRSRASSLLASAIGDQSELRHDERRPAHVEQ